MNKDPHTIIDDDDDPEGYRKIDHYNHDSLNKLSQSYLEVLQNLGENTSREGILKTPERVAKAMQFLTQGYHLNAKEILESARFREDYKQMVIVKDIEV